MGLLALALGTVALTEWASAGPVFSTYADHLKLPPQVMPADPIPRRSDLWSTSFVDPELAGVTFFSENRPLITMCLGEEATCRLHFGLSEVLRSERMGRHMVTVGVVYPGSAEELGLDLLEYWKSVPLVSVTSDPSSHPAWMDEKSMYTR